MATTEHKQHQPREVLERGDIFFLRPPTPNEADATKPSDVISFFLLMHEEHAMNHRLLHVGQKKGREGGKHCGKHYWGVVYEIVEMARPFDEIMEDRNYASAQRCARDMMMMQPSGMGEYQVQRQGDCTYLSYALLPQLNKRALLATMQIPAAANYLIRAKNPNASASPASLPSVQGDNRDDTRAATLRQHVQQHFAGRPFISVDPPQLLDHQGLEILFLGVDTHMHAPPDIPDSHEMSEPYDMPDPPDVDVSAQCAAAEQDANAVFAALRMPPPATATVQNASSLRARWH